MKEQPQRPHSEMRRVFKFFLFALVAAMIFAAPIHSLVNFFARVFNSPPTPFLQIAVSVIWVLLVYQLFHVIAYVSIRLSPKQERRPTVMDDFLAALDSIATGDFNVSLDTQMPGHYQELALKINHMAGELSNMEQLRQDFISNVSHELQSPLTSIGGFAELLQEENLPPEKRRRYAEIIGQESKRLAKLGNNLLQLSLLSAGQVPFTPQPFRLDKQLENTLLMLEPQWQEKELALQLDLAELTVTGDQDLLSQVWINLLHNSIKFTPQKGGISVQLIEKDGEAVCRIKDTGIGIAEEDLTHIFERFYKADKARDRSLGGNGLGLSLVQTIIKLHHGKIHVESKLGQGSMFTVTIPLQTAV